MKTIIKTSALLVTFTLLLAANMSASAFNFEEESYINDIPFDAEEVYNDFVVDQQLVEFDFEEESYVNDIPFDTACISANCKYSKAMLVEFNFEEETYIDDMNM